MTRQNKRCQIMQAAEKLFTSRRFHEITMEDVALEAGVGKGTIYGYFRGKEDLFFKTVTAGFDEMHELVRRRMPGEGDFRGKLLSISRHIHDFLERRRPLFQMMQSEQNRMLCQRGRLRERFMDQRGKLVSAVGDVFRQGMAANEVRGDLDPEVLAHFFLGMLRTRALDLAAGAPPASHEQIVDLFCHGAARMSGRPDRFEFKATVNTGAPEAVSPGGRLR